MSDLNFSVEKGPERDETISRRRWTVAWGWQKLQQAADAYYQLPVIESTTNSPTHHETTAAVTDTATKPQTSEIVAAPTEESAVVDSTRADLAQARLMVQESYHSGGRND